MGTDFFNVLLVEDNSAHAALVRRAFRRYEGNFKLDICVSLAEAREYMSKNQPDILITDMRLPDGDGIELIPKKDDGVVRSFPIMVMTSYGNEEIAVSAIKAGALDYIVKSSETLSDMPHIARRSMREWSHIVEKQLMEIQLKEFLEKMANAERLAELGTLSATLAHELNQPLTVLKLLLQDCETEIKPFENEDEFKGMVRDCLREIETAELIVRRFRNYAHPVNKRYLVNISLSNIIGKIIPLLQKQADMKKLDLVVDESLEDLPEIFSCESDIQQLCFIFVENAIQISPGDKRVSMLISGKSDKNNVYLYFEDQCGGIKPEFLENIFDPFFTTKSDLNATGLGLCIAKRITEDMAGHISVESTYGKGTVFKIKLPIHE